MKDLSILMSAYSFIVLEKTMTCCYMVFSVIFSKSIAPVLMQVSQQNCTLSHAI